MKNIRNKLDRLPRPISILLTILTGPLYGAFYRFSKLDATGILLGILWIVTLGGFAVGWIIDIYSVATGRGIVFLV